MGVKFMGHLSLDGKYWNAHIAWICHCRNNNLPDPFEALENLRAEYTEYKELSPGRTQVIIHDMTEEQKNRQKELEKYRNEYISERELFTGQFLLNNYGYNDLINFAQAQDPYHRKLIEWLNTIGPCEGKDGQCSFFCPIFNQCSKIGD